MKDDIFLKNMIQASQIGKQWFVGRVDRSKIKIVPPTKRPFYIEDALVDWNTVYAADSPTDRLWAYSLRYLPHIAKQGGVDLAVSVAESFYDFERNSPGRLESRLPASWDHAVAMRLEAMTLLAAIGDQRQAQSIYGWIAGDVGWALDGSHLKLNNHGLMLATAVLTASQFVRYFDLELAAKMEQYGADSIGFILRRVFGSDGYCNENSPFYAHFYITKLKGLQENYGDLLDRTGLAPLIEETKVAGLRTLGNILFQDSHIPPNGDSSPQRTWYESHLGRHLSRRTGLWVHKTDDLYLSMKSGHDSWTHKHVDDTSITVRFKGVDFITDSGFCSYDYRDPRILMLRTQRAHSGLFFRDFDLVRPSEFYGEKKRMVAGIFERAGKVSGSYIIDGQYSAHRTILPKSDDSIEIRDSFHSPEGSQAIQRYVLPEDSQFTLTDGGFDVERRGRKMSVLVEQGHTVRTYLGQNVAPYLGWTSLRPREISPSLCVEVSLNDPRVREIASDISFR